MRVWNSHVSETMGACAQSHKITSHIFDATQQMR